MALKIWGPDAAAPKAEKAKFTDDIVGRFRSGYQVNNRPVALAEWRVTTGDPSVAAAVSDAFGGEPQDWDATGEDSIEVFTDAGSVDILLEGTNAIRQAMILWGRNNKIIRKTDGETILYPPELAGQPDPQASESFAERKAAAKAGTGAEPQVEVYFRLAADPDLGVFKFQSGSWSLVSDLAYYGTEDALSDALADSDEGKARAVLSLEEVSFTAKSGPRAGKVVQYTKPAIKVMGPA